MPRTIPFPGSAASPQQKRRPILNALSIRSLKTPTAGRVDYFDDATPGLSLRVTAKDVRTWTVFYRDKNGRQPRGFCRVCSPSMATRACAGRRLEQIGRSSMRAAADDKRVKATQDYVRLADQGRPEVLDLFDEDAEIYFPKLGFGFGRQSLFEMTKGGALEFIQHDYDALTFIPARDSVVVEGTSHGGMSGKVWAGGETPGGRFCNVFKFRGDRISSLHVYLDPDYTGEGYATVSVGPESQMVRSADLRSGEAPGSAPSCRSFIAATAISCELQVELIEDGVELPVDNPSPH